MLVYDCRKVTGALKIVHEKYQKTDLYNNFLEQFSDAVTKNEFIEAHLRKARLIHSHTTSQRMCESIRQKATQASTCQAQL